MFWGIEARVTALFNFVIIGLQNMFEVARQLWILIKKTDKLWLIPLLLVLVILGLLIVGAQISPVPVFIYPLI